MASLLTALAFTLGLAAITVGVTFIYWPAGPITGGLFVCIGAYGYQRGTQGKPVSTDV
jgi:hypothetical protein